MEFVEKSICKYIIFDYDLYGVGYDNFIYFEEVILDFLNIDLKEVELEYVNFYIFLFLFYCLRRWNDLMKFI